MFQTKKTTFFKSDVRQTEGNTFFKKTTFSNLTSAKLPDKLGFQKNDIFFKNIFLQVWSD